jgi:alanine-glyoxylate transaminase/serine-glyoxylate transaminase/serine-pyruvate transaminase
MIALDQHPSGRHFLQIPGPSPVPDRILRALSLPTIDHRGPEFAHLGKKVLSGMQRVFQTRHPVVIYPASGTGAWEAALANTMSAGDAVLMFETGHFASLWHKMALRLGLAPEFLSVAGTDPATGLPWSWRRGVQADLIEARLRADGAHAIKAVCVVHNETSTGATSDIAAVRRAIDAARHPALLMVDTISGLASADYRHDEWGVDVSISGSQKGLMLPPGISFNALSPKALVRQQVGDPCRRPTGRGTRSSRRTRAATGLRRRIPICCMHCPKRSTCSSSRGSRRSSSGISAGGRRPQRGAGLGLADPVRRSLCLLTGTDRCRHAGRHRCRCDSQADPRPLRPVARHRLGKVRGRMFRIGHLGDCNDLTLMAALAGVEMGLKLGGVALAGSGVQAAMEFFASHPSHERLQAAA